MSITKADAVARLVRGLQITEAEAIALFLRMVPTITLDDLSDDFQSDVFQDRKAVQRNEQTATVAARSVIGFRNPAGSGVDCIVRVAIVSSSATGKVLGSLLPISGAGLTITSGPNGGQYRDRRRSGATAAGVFAATTPGSIGTAFFEYRRLANTPWAFDLDFLIPPGGDQLLITTLSTNQDLAAVYLWAEIPQALTT